MKSLKLDIENMKKDKKKKIKEFENFISFSSSSVPQDKIIKKTISFDKTNDVIQIFYNFPSKWFFFPKTWILDYKNENLVNLIFKVNKEMIASSASVNFFHNTLKNADIDYRFLEEVENFPEDILKLIKINCC